MKYFWQRLCRSIVELVSAWAVCQQEKILRDFVSNKTISNIDMFPTKISGPAFANDIDPWSSILTSIGSIVSRPDILETIREILIEYFGAEHIEIYSASQEDVATTDCCLDLQETEPLRVGINQCQLNSGILCIQLSQNQNIEQPAAHKLLETWEISSVLLWWIWERGRRLSSAFRDYSHPIYRDTNGKWNVWSRADHEIH